MMWNNNLIEIIEQIRKAEKEQKDQAAQQRLQDKVKLEREGKSLDHACDSFEVFMKERFPWFEKNKNEMTVSWNWLLGFWLQAQQRI